MAHENDPAVFSPFHLYEISLYWSKNIYMYFHCRLELKGNKYLLGEFVEFQGRQEDVRALRNIKRSKVGRVIIQKMSMFGLGNFSTWLSIICNFFRLIGFINILLYYSLPKKKKGSKKGETLYQKEQCNKKFPLKHTSPSDPLSCQHEESSWFCSLVNQMKTGK